ncbi:MAG: hypothetical protein KDJ90_12570 [Nitratireductor sp.]|nr:hypothetical protein [Nitratireductor sp.]
MAGREEETEVVVSSELQAMATQLDGTGTETGAIIARQLQLLAEISRLQERELEQWRLLGTMPNSSPQGLAQ